MSEPFDLVVAGRPSVDVMFAELEAWPELGADVDAAGLGVCAGTSFNTPAAAHRLGLRVALVATLGNDVWSRMIADEFAAEGLPTDHLEIQDRPLPGVSVALNRDGDRGFVTHWGSDETYDADLTERARSVLARVDARHFHAYADDAPELESIAAGRGMTVSLDAWGGPTYATSRPLAEVLANADVVFANRQEAAAMTGEDDPERAAMHLSELCDAAVVKLGADGAVGAHGGRISRVEADVVPVIDTTGAGDCLNAGFLAGWLAGLPFEASLALAVICGSRAVADFGGYRGCPREPDLRRIAADRGLPWPELRGSGS